jgi:hypothetical protein
LPISEKPITPIHFEKPQTSQQPEQSQSTIGITGGLLDLPSTTLDYDPDKIDNFFFHNYKI